MSSDAAGIPEVGQAVQIRNRLATVLAVEPYDARGPQGRLHIVEVEYLDDCRYPEAEQVLWEVEATAKILGATSLPSVDANNPDHPAALRSFVNAHRWTRLNRLRESNDIRDEPLLGVWNSAIQIHPYQLEAVIHYDIPWSPSKLQQRNGRVSRHGQMRDVHIEADRLRLRVEIDALCADLYGLDPDDFDWIVRDDPKDPKGFDRVDRQLPFRERLTGLSAAAFRALKDGKWSAETAAQLTNDQFFDLLGIPELTSPTAAKSKGFAAPLIQKRDGCHAWHPENFPEEDPRHGWTWDDCRPDALTLLGSEQALHQYITQTEDGSSSLVSGNENPTTNYQRPTTTYENRPLRRPPPHRPFGNEIRPKKKRRRK